MLVMADGVGSWMKKGVNAGLFARDLVNGLQELH
jgi:hypothetical protein